MNGTVVWRKWQSIGYLWSSTGFSTSLVGYYVLDIDFGGSNSKISLSSLVAFFDDEVVIATGRDTNILEDVTNRALVAMTE